MTSFDQAAQWLDEAMTRLPQGIFDELNGGVNLLPEEKRSEDGSYIMGLYHHNTLGRYIEIYYGSFAALYGKASRSEFRAQLEETLHHELTHHVESKAGDRSLERWDEEQALLRAMEREIMNTNSLLFVCSDGFLAAAASAFFRRMAAARCPEMVCEHTALHPGDVPPQALKAAKSLGLAPEALLEPTLPLVEDILAVHGAVFCMTEAQADELAQQFPALDQRILCLGPRDIHPPRFSGGWTRVLRKLEEEVALLVEDFCDREEQR